MDPKSAGHLVPGVVRAENSFSSHKPQQRNVRWASLSSMSASCTALFDRTLPSVPRSSRELCSYKVSPKNRTATATSQAAGDFALLPAKRMLCATRKGTAS
jgi:hypothetical protein